MFWVAWTLFPSSVEAECLRVLTQGVKLQLTRFGQDYSFPDPLSYGVSGVWCKWRLSCL